MDYQKKIYEQLVFGPFPSNLAQILYKPNLLPGDVLYVTAGYKVQEPNLSRPDDARHKFEHDVIMTLVQCGERTNEGRTRRKIVNKDIISIEIKTTADNIFNSTIDQYLGATRLFSYACPTVLLPPLIYHLRSLPQKEIVGVIDSDTGQIVVLPQFQCYHKDRCDRLLARCYTSEHRFPFCNGDTEPYRIHRIMENDAPVPEWISKNGLRVNSTYLNLFRH